MFFFTKKFQYSIVILIILFNLGFNSPLIIYEVNSTNESQAKCEYTDNLQFFWWMDIFNSTIIPFIIMIISSSSTVFMLFRMKKRLNGLKFRDYRFAAVSIGLNVSFFLFNMPTTVFFLLSSYIDFEQNLYFLLLILTNFLFFVNFGKTFYINFAFNTSYRKKIFIFFKKILNKLSC